MLMRKAVIGSVASLGLLLGVVSNKTVAQMPQHRKTFETAPAGQFRRIEQPFWVTGAVTVGGLSLIGLELWWFLLSKPKFSKKKSLAK
ncbi:MAG: hypothetical protein ACRDEA_03420 [Microcystaceae cyanobacterium]